MTKADRIARNKLIDYAKKFLKVTARPDEPISVTPEQIASFAAQLREGCRQDIIRLIASCSAGTPDTGGKLALDSLACAVDDGEIIELWGLPDCACGHHECVYCGRGYATKPAPAATPLHPSRPEDFASGASDPRPIPEPLG